MQVGRLVVYTFIGVVSLYTLARALYVQLGVFEAFVAYVAFVSLMVSVAASVGAFAAGVEKDASE